MTQSAIQNYNRLFGHI